MTNAINHLDQATKSPQENKEGKTGDYLPVSTDQIQVVRILERQTMLLEKIHKILTFFVIALIFSLMVGFVIYLENLMYG